MRIPLTTIKNYSPAKQHLWFQAVQAALARKRISEERSLRRAHLNDIRQYFQPKTMASQLEPICAILISSGRQLQVG